MRWETGAGRDEGVGEVGGRPNPSGVCTGGVGVGLQSLGGRLKWVTIFQPSSRGGGGTGSTLGAGGAGTLGSGADGGRGCGGASRGWTGERSLNAATSFHL